jgi:hypothetical protein
MPATKSVAQSSDKWVRRAGAAAQDYRAGVQNPRTSWQEATLDAEEAQAAGVQEAIADGRFAKGVAAAGNQKWQSKAASKGADRFGPGVQAGKSDYERGFAPYQSVLSGLTLPPRGAKGDPRNLERVRAVAEALREAKTSK